MDLLRLSMVSSNAIVGGVVVVADAVVSVCMVYICEFTATANYYYFQLSR